MGKDILDWIMEHVFPWFFIIVFIVGFSLLGYIVWKPLQSPTFSLHKSEWVCTDMQTAPFTTYMLSGKVMIPITTYKHECYQWSKTAINRPQPGGKGE